jgi:hypothetical protein
MKTLQAIKLVLASLVSAMCLSGVAPAFALDNPFPDWCKVNPAQSNCEWRPTNEFVGKKVEVLATAWAAPFYQSDTFHCPKAAKECSIARTIGSNSCQTNSTDVSKTLGSSNDLKAGLKIWEIVEVGVSGTVAQSRTDSTGSTVRTCTNESITYRCVMNPSTAGHVYGRYGIQTVKTSGERVYQLWAKAKGVMTKQSPITLASFAGTVKRPFKVDRGCAIRKE